MQIYLLLGLNESIHIVDFLTPLALTYKRPFQQSNELRYAMDGTKDLCNYIIRSKVCSISKKSYVHIVMRRNRSFCIHK